MFSRLEEDGRQNSEILWEREVFLITEKVSILRAGGSSVAEESLFETALCRAAQVLLELKGKMVRLHQMLGLKGR